MRYRIALCGFGEFEYRALRFSIEHAATLGGAGYDVVPALAQADFAVVDADSKQAVIDVVQSGRLPHAVFVGAEVPAGVPLHLPRPIDPTRIRRLLDQLSEPSRAPRLRTKAPMARTLPTLDDAIAAPADHAGAPVAHPSDDAQRAARAAARSATRLAQRASQRAKLPAVEPLRDVLVLDADADASSVLCALLERFGFNAYSVRSIEQAFERLTVRPYVAYFLDIVLGSDEPGPNPGADANAALALLRRIQERPMPEGHPAPAVQLTTRQLHPADRVRATLAGLAPPLVKPLARGDVARALEGSGVVLPADARRR